MNKISKIKTSIISGITRMAGKFRHFFFGCEYESHIDSLKEANARLKALLDIQLAMGKKRGIEELLNFIASSALETTSGIMARIVLVDLEKYSFSVDITASRNPEADAVIADIVAHIPLPMQTFDDLQVVLDTDLFSLDFSVDKVIRPAGLCGFLKGMIDKDVCERIEIDHNIGDIAIVPLEFDGNILGFLRIISSAAINDDLLLMLSGQAAQAIREAEHIREIRENEDRLEQLVLDRTAELERKNDELLKTQEFVLGQEKMAGIGQLAAGVAHEINNPIAYVYSNLNVLREYKCSIQKCHDKLIELTDLFATGRSDEAASLKSGIESNGTLSEARRALADMDPLIEESVDGVQRVRDIVRNLKDFSMPGEKDPVLTDLNVGIEQALAMLRSELKYKVTVHRELAPLPYVRCRPQELNQVFMNVILNAAQSIDKKGDIYVRSRVENDAVVIEIEDNGAGIPKENMKRIFEPFFSTKEIGKGSGLGLPASYGIVRRHGGTIEVDSEPGRGSRFTITLPIKGSPFMPAPETGFAESEENESKNAESVPALERMERLL